MDNLFNISNELRNIIEDIEVQGGEITDEQAERLEVREQEMKDKLDNYRKAILVLKYQEAMCSDEIKRLQAAKKAKTNVINKLNNSVLNAVVEFGEDSKSGNKTYSTDTFKFYTVNRKSVELDEHRLQVLCECFKAWATELNDNDCLVSDFDDYDFNPDNVIIWINKYAHQKGILQDEEPDFKVDDLYCAKLKFEASIELASLIKADKIEILKVGIDNEETVSTTMDAYSSTEIKNMMELPFGEVNPTIAKMVVKPVINMR